MASRPRIEHWTRVLGGDVLLPGRRARSAEATQARGETPARGENPGDAPSAAEARELRAAIQSEARRREAAASPGSSPAPSFAGSPAPAAASGTPARPEDPGARVARLEELRAQAAACQRCGLCEGRTKSVFSDGDPGARIAFVGEGPGADEDRQGVPFVGRAGQLLTRIIERAMGLPREQVYICNVVKCRPPGNRNPSPEEQAACAPFLREQLELVAPDLVITLGKVATQFLLGKEGAMSRFRGRIHRVGELSVLATWHPAYLLRTPSAKAQTWEDIKAGLRFLGMSDSPQPYARPETPS